MKFAIPGSLVIGALIVSAAMIQARAQPTPAPAAATQAMPCGRMRPACPQAGQPMVPRGPMGPGMQGTMGPGGLQRSGPRMGHGYHMGQGNPPGASGGEVIYGSQLMTPEERAVYRAKLRAATTAEERVKIRAEHHKEMQERAKKLGKTLPPAPGGQGRPPAASGGQGIYGSQLMTPEERAAYRAKMRAAATPEERAKIRAEHYKEMQERAKKAGMTLAPPSQSG